MSPLPLVMGVVFAAICGVVAHSKGRNVVLWVVLGFLFGCFSLIIVAVLPNLTEQRERDTFAAEENRRLREQLRQERIKSESFRQHASARLDAHDQHLGLDTRSMGPTLTGGTPAAAELGSGEAGGEAEAGFQSETEHGTATATDDTPRWYYGNMGRTVGPVRLAEITELIRLQIVRRETLVWCQEMADWRAAADVPALAGRFA